LPAGEAVVAALLIGDLEFEAAKELARVERI